MKTKILLLVDADDISAELVSIAAAKTGHQLVGVHTSRDAFLMMERGLDHLDAIVIDLDPGVHGLAVLEALDASATTPPVIVLTGLEEAYMSGIAAAHGAAACLAKPFFAEKLASLIEEVCEPAWRSETWTSDAWGHQHRCQHAAFPCPGCCHRKMPAPTELECANV